MISAHQEIDSFVANQIDESMLLSDPSRPHVGTEVAQGFGFADTLKGDVLVAIELDQFDVPYIVRFLLERG